MISGPKGHEMDTCINFYDILTRASFDWIRFAQKEQLHIKEHRLDIG